MDEINTGSSNVIDVRSKSINRGVHNGIAFANFKDHKFSYLNITSLGTDYVLYVLTYRHVSPITWLHFMTSAEESYVNCSLLTSTTTQTSSSAANISITSV